MKRERGFAFAAALMLMLVVAILVTAVLTMSMSARLLASSRHEYTQAIYLAEAGVNTVIADWRDRGAENPPAQPYQGVLATGGAAGLRQRHPDRRLVHRRVRVRADLLAATGFLEKNLTYVKLLATQ